MLPLSVYQEYRVKYLNWVVSIERRYDLGYQSKVLVDETAETPVIIHGTGNIQFETGNTESVLDVYE
jgi:hypothetical protein